MLKKLAAIRWANDRFHELVRDGKSVEEAHDTVLHEGATKFGAIDWATLLPLIMQLMTLIMSFFKPTT